MTTSRGPQRPDLERELKGLKDFQRDTVEHVHDRLFGDDPTRRFLVADEVGLGKTLVARGIIAKAIDTLWEDVPRIDVVYICSNAQIARQNLKRLRVASDILDTGAGGEEEFADRLTLFAAKVDSFEGRKLNFVSFSPGTSFHVSDSGGTARERVLLYWMLRTQLPELRERYWLRFFRGASGFRSFSNQVKWFDRKSIPQVASAQLLDQLRSHQGESGSLWDDVIACVEQFKWKKDDWWPPHKVSRERYRLIGQMRRMLAKAAVAALEPDIVILDEFQRFTSLLHDDNPGAELARALFDHGEARLILLSATPFKMYTLPDDEEGEDHYSGFLQTVGFLAGDERRDVVAQGLSDLRRALLIGDKPAAIRARDLVQAELTRVMSRTERLASTPDRDGMVIEATMPDLELDPQDVRDFQMLARVAKALDQPDVLEYWRSSPYLLELMEQYKIKQRLEADGVGHVEVVSALHGHRRGLTKQAINAFEPLEPGNAKMRALVADTLDRGSWRLAWIPPSLPYYELSGPYAEGGLAGLTKRLIFSSWTVVPKAIATLLSFEAERRLREAGSTSERTYDAKRSAGPLTFATSGTQLRGMPVLALLLPSPSLARLGDPLAIASEEGLGLPLSRTDLERQVRDRIEMALADVPQGQDTSITDDSWYWAAPLLLDKVMEGVEPASILHLSFGVDGEEMATRFDEQRRHAAYLDARTLGRRPDDLVEVLAELALGGPGVNALRALGRVCGGLSMAGEPAVRDAASRIAFALRNHLNQPEMVALVRTSNDERAYWREVLGHCLDGGLGAVLDEWAHVLNESAGVAEKGLAEKASSIATEMVESLSLRATTNSVSDIRVGDSRLQLESFRMRSHYAVRFGRGVTEEATEMRESQARQAFNSPFWPFVLASTSVGQEGLDFHQYSHAVVHWNLPSNPVDLEQREGRVHRYKGHAVRKNVAMVHGGRPEVAAAVDPWAEMFRLALEERNDRGSMIHPYWVYPVEGGSRIERYVPALPLSSETYKYRRLMRTVGAYRLVLGQPRQDDLLSYLGDSAADFTDALIDLSPPQSSRP